MLVLSRKKGQSLLISENIWVKVCDVRGNKVRLGIGAPKEINVVREELIEDTVPTQSSPPLRGPERCSSSEHPQQSLQTEDDTP